MQYEIDGFFQQTRVKYLHTTIAGRRAFHQVLAWSTYSRYDRKAFESVLNGFTEIADSAAASEAVPTTEPMQIVPVSRYEFH